MIETIEGFTLNVAVFQQNIAAGRSPIAFIVENHARKYERRKLLLQTFQYTFLVHFSLSTVKTRLSCFLPSTQRYFTSSQRFSQLRTIVPALKELWKFCLSASVTASSFHRLCFLIICAN